MRKKAQADKAPQRIINFHQEDIAKVTTDLRGHIVLFLIDHFMSPTMHDKYLNLHKLNWYVNISFCEYCSFGMDINYR
jgi:hypothetical protein